MFPQRFLHGLKGTLLSLHAWCLILQKRMLTGRCPYIAIRRWQDPLLELFYSIAAYDHHIETSIVEDVCCRGQDTPHMPLLFISKLLVRQRMTGI